MVAVVGLVLLGVGVLGALLPSVLLLVRKRASRAAAGEPGPVRPRSARELAEEAKASGPPDLTATQLDFYVQHHEKALSDSALTFRLGVLSASLGFVAILGSVAIFVFRGGDSAWIGTVSGAVCEAVGLLFFAQDREARKQADRMFAMLDAQVVRTSATNTAREIAESLPDGEKQKLLVQIAVALVKGSPPEAAGDISPREND